MGQNNIIPYERIYIDAFQNVPLTMDPILYCANLCIESKSSHLKIYILIGLILRHLMLTINVTISKQPTQQLDNKCVRYYMTITIPHAR